MLKLATMALDTKPEKTRILISHDASGTNGSSTTNKD